MKNTAKKKEMRDVQIAKENSGINKKISTEKRNENSTFYFFAFGGRVFISCFVINYSCYYCGCVGMCSQPVIAVAVYLCWFSLTVININTYTAIQIHADTHIQ